MPHALVDPVLLLLLIATSWALYVLAHTESTVIAPRRPRRPSAEPVGPTPRSRRGHRKPEWVRTEVARLAALDPNRSCRKIAAAFCATFHNVESVGKSWVAAFLRDEKHRIEATRREIRRRRPRHIGRNRIWALDLTSIPIGTSTNLALGILDHGTRACIALRDLPSKHSFRILAEVVGAIRNYGKPLKIRTDNEAIFTSRLLRWGLHLLGILHQPIEKMAPWQNGRIERFFGTFKPAWRLFGDRSGLVVGDVQAELDVFRGWYNHIRPYMHLGGRVPADAWSGKSPARRSGYDVFSEWEEVLTGFHFQ